MDNAEKEQLISRCLNLTGTADALRREPVDRWDISGIVAADARIYRMIAQEIRKPDAAERLDVLVNHTDSRLLCFALCWYRKDLFKNLRFEHIRLPARPVKKVAVFCRYLRNGGAERCASLLMKLFVSKGLETFHFAGEAPTADDYPVPPGIERVILPQLPHERRIELEMYLRSKDIDTCIFIDHAEWITIHDILSARHAGCRTIVQEHSNYFYPWRTGNPLLAMERAAVYPAADAVTLLSKCDLMLWQTLHALERVLFMPNMLTFEQTEPQKNSGSGTHDLVFAGRLSKDKGAMYALEVVEKLLPSYPDVRLFMLGRPDSPEFDAALHQKAASSPALQQAVIFTGHTPEVRKYFSNSSILLMPSAFEGYPMTLMEAKACNLPCVMFEMPYLEAAVKGCIQTPQGDADAMAAAVKMLFDEPDKLCELAKAAGESLSEFSNDKISALWDKLFDHLASGSANWHFDTPAAGVRQWETMAKEWYKAMQICQEHPEYTSHIATENVHEYLQQHPFSHLLAKINEKFPRLCNALNSLLRRKKKEKIRDDGFPSYD